MFERVLVLRVGSAAGNQRYLLRSVPSTRGLRAVRGTIVGMSMALAVSSVKLTDRQIQFIINALMLDRWNLLNHAHRLTVSNKQMKEINEQCSEMDDLTVLLMRALDEVNERKRNE